MPLPLVQTGGGSNLVTSVAGKTGAVTLVEGDIASLTTDLAATEKTANKDAASGYAGLTAGSLLKAAEFPTPTTSTFGGVKDVAAVANNFATSMVNGVLVLARPQISNLSDTPAANLVVASPNGSSGAVAARALVAADIPILSTSSQDGIFVGADLSFALTSAAASSAIGVNACRAVQVVIPVGITFTKMTIAITTLFASGNYYIGIYNAAGATLLRQATFSTSSAVAVTATVASTTLAPGTYWLLWSCDNGTALVRAIGNVAAVTGNQSAAIFVANKARIGNSSLSTSAGVLPATIGTITSASVNYPTVYLEA